MGYRNIGPNVSQSPQAVTPGGGQYTAQDHSFESLVFEQGKPPLDWEMNLMQEVVGPYGFRKSIQRILPSSWIVGGFLESSAPQSFVTLTPDVPAATTANQMMMVASDVIVNGWVLHYEYSGTPTAGYNLIQLPLPPISGTRTDLVILEVWRALISPAPDGTNKSPTGQIYVHGNVKAPDSTGNQNLLDDLTDPTFGAESSRRVQIQYRYRVIQGITSLSDTPDGLEDPAVFANTVPHLGGSGVDGAATTYSFTKSSGDPGLWVAGTGSPTDATALGTVDGYVYAVPVCAVFRRNSSAFNRSTNLNGAGLMSSGVSGRPDGLYADQIVLGDIKDLRKAIAYDLGEVMTKAYNQVLDNTLSTEHELSADGPAGVSFLARDNIGLSEHIGNPDGVRVNFSDRSVTESIVVKLTSPGASTTLSLASLPTPWGTFALAGLAPVGTNIVGIGRCRVVASGAEVDLSVWSSGGGGIVVSLSSSVPGGAVDTAAVTFPFAPDIAYLELLIEYPGSHGVKRNVTAAAQFWTPPAANIASWVDTAQLTATTDSTRLALSTSQWWMDVAHRELSVRLHTVIQTFSGYFSSGSDQAFYVPDNITGSVTVTYNYNSGGSPTAHTFVTSGYEFNSGYTRIPADSAYPPYPGTSFSAVYTALRPLPPVAAAPGDSYQVFYQTRAIQSIAVPGGTQTLQLVPRVSGPGLAVITAGSGSPDNAFPFGSPSAQIPVGALPSSSFPEAALNMPATLSVVGFGTNTGFVQLPVLIPYVPDPGQVTLYKGALDQTVDGDGRNFWPKSDSGSTAYSPVVYSQELSFKQRHKVAYPVLMELKSDFPQIGRKGTLVLVVFSSWTDFSEQNTVQLTSSVSNSCAAIYRVRGNMLNPRRTI